MEQVLIVSGIGPGTGGMDSGNQGWLMAKAMKKYLGWDAKCLVFGESYLQYPVDWVFEQNVGIATVLEYASNCTYFIFLDSIVDIPQLPLGRYLTPNNHCIVGVGSGLRHTVDQVLMAQIKHDLVVVTPPQDETLTTQLMGVPFDFVIVDIDEIVELVDGIEKNDEFTVCHAHTNPGSKGGELITRLESDPDLAGVKFDAISGLSWEQTIKRKAKSHVVIDDLVMPTYGLNVLEAMVLRQHVVTRIGHWCYMIYPDFPVKPCEGLDMYEAVKTRILDLKSRDVGASLVFRHAPLWVRSHHHASVVAEKLGCFVEWAKCR